jgi:hypothetical protein
VIYTQIVEIYDNQIYNSTPISNTIFVF